MAAMLTSRMATYFRSYTNLRCLGRIIKNRSCTATVRQYQTRQRSRYENFYGSKTTTRLLLPALFGISFFGKPKNSDDETDTKPAAPKPAAEDELITVLKHAKLSEMKKELVDADRHYHRALGLVNIYQQNKTWDAGRVLQARVYIYDGLANVALAKGELEKAEVLYKETLRGSIQQGMRKDDDAVVEISLKLAMIYAAQKRVEDAAEGYRFCIKTQEEKMRRMTKVDDNSTALFGMAVDAYARFLMVQTRYADARDNLEKALAVARKVYGDAHPQVAVLYNDIATVCSLTSDYDVAKENLDRAVEIAERVNSLDLPTFYFNRGAIQERRRETEDAKREYTKALTLAKKNDDKAVVKKSTAALKSLKTARLTPKTV